MNLTEAANHLGVAAKTVRRFAEHGDVKAMHPLHDGPWVFNSTDLEDPSFRARLEQRLSGTTPAGPDVSNSPWRFQPHTEVKHCDSHL